jgi:hypothetical protein
LELDTLFGPYTAPDCCKRAIPRWAKIAIIQKITSAGETMKFFTWISMSIFVALVISWPLALLFGVPRWEIALISLAGGALLMVWPSKPRAPK